MMKNTRWKSWRAWVALAWLGLWCIGPLLPFIILNGINVALVMLAECSGRFNDWLAACNISRVLERSFRRSMDRTHKWVQAGD